MAKLAGDHVQVLVDGYELTGDSNRIIIDESRDLFDITAFGDAVHKFSPGQRTMALQHAGFMNSAEGALASGPAGGGGGRRCSRSTWARTRRRRLATRSSVCWRGRGRYGALPQVNRMIPFRAGFCQSRRRWRLGDRADAAGRCDRDRLTGSTVDNGGANDGGGLACLHVLEAAAGDAYSHHD